VGEGVSEKEIEEIEAWVADRCVDILLDNGVFVCSPVYD